jgi:hypothetical protein
VACLVKTSLAWSLQGNSDVSRLSVASRSLKSFSIESFS